MAFGLDKQIGSVKVGHLVGIVGFLGDLTAVFSIVSGRVAFIIIIVSSLLVLIWGLLVRNDQALALRVIAWLSIVLSSIAIILVVAASSILLLGDPPSSLGAYQSRDFKEFQLSGDKQAARLTGQYELKFEKTDDMAEVGLMPSPEDTERVSEVVIRSVGGVPEQLDKMGELINKRTPTAIYYEVENPSPDFKATLNFVVHLKQPLPDPRIKMRAHYTYARRDWLWKVKIWLFEYLGEQLQ